MTEVYIKPCPPELMYSKVGLRMPIRTSRQTLCLEIKHRDISAEIHEFVRDSRYAPTNLPVSDSFGSI